MLKRTITILRTEGVKSFINKGLSYLNIYSKLFLLIGKLLNIIDLIVPNKNIVLFGSQRGYEGSSRFVYEWLVDNNPEKRAVWMARSNQEAQILNKKGLPAVNKKSLSGLKLLVMGKYAVINKGFEDIAVHPYLVPSSLKSVYVQHGVSLPKKHLVRETPIQNNVLKYDFYICSSEFQKELSLLKLTGYNKVRDVPNSIRNTHKVTGFPKTDLLIDPSEEIKEKWRNFSDDQTNKTIILYAPTHGHKSADSSTIQKDIFPFSDFDTGKLDKILTDIDAHLYIRPHPSDLKNMAKYSYGSYSIMNEKINNICSSSDRVSLATSEDISTIEILPFTDILITDYSDIYIEFLPENKPIVFIDGENYEPDNQESFGFDYEEYKPGPTVNSFNELRQYFVDIDSGNDKYANDRRALADKFYKYLDSGARERVADLLE